jgi:hypothetical protein
MKVFLIACAVALILGVGSVYVLNSVQESSTVAYTSPSGVRL